jgi:hypothetical protein
MGMVSPVMYNVKGKVGSGLLVDEPDSIRIRGYSIGDQMK